MSVLVYEQINGSQLSWLMMSDVLVFASFMSLTLTNSD